MRFKTAFQDYIHYRIVDYLEKKNTDPNKQLYAIFPFGKFGNMTYEVLVDRLSISRDRILKIDNNKIEDDIHTIEYLRTISENEHIILVIASYQQDVLDNVRKTIYSFYDKTRIIDLFLHENLNVGRFSYGPLARPNPLIERVGAFCSFAEGCAVVSNHPMNFVSTHPFLYNYGFDRIPEYDLDSEIDEYNKRLAEVVDGFPIEYEFNMRKVVIGNDVWL